MALCNVNYSSSLFSFGFDLRYGEPQASRLACRIRGEAYLDTYLSLQDKDRVPICLCVYLLSVCVFTVYVCIYCLSMYVFIICLCMYLLSEKAAC